MDIKFLTGALCMSAGMAQFGYGGKLLPTFPRWPVDCTRPSRLAWMLKERSMPPLYWKGMLKGREWLARPELVD